MANKQATRWCRWEKKKWFSPHTCIFPGFLSRLGQYVDLLLFIRTPLLPPVSQPSGHCRAFTAETPLWYGLLCPSLLPDASLAVWFLHLLLHWDGGFWRSAVINFSGFFLLLSFHHCWGNRVDMLFRISFSTIMSSQTSFVLKCWLNCALCCYRRASYPDKGDNYLAKQSCWLNKDKCLAFRLSDTFRLHSCVNTLEMDISFTTFINWNYILIFEFKYNWWLLTFWKLLLIFWRNT